MSTPLLVDFIELQARGVTDVQEAMKALGKQIADAEKANQDLLDSLNDPANAKAARQYLQMARQQEALKRTEAERLSLLRQRQGLESRINSTRSGSYGDSLSKQIELQRLEAKAREAERRVAMQPKFVEQRRALADVQRMEAQRAQTMLQRESLLARQRDVTSGRYGKALNSQIDLAKLEQQVKDAEKKAQQANPQYQKFKRDQSELLRVEAQRTTEMKRREQVQGRIDDVQSGRFTDRLKSDRQIGELDRLARSMERRAQLDLKYGRFGGLAHGLERVGQSGVARGIGAGLGGVGMLGSGLMGFASAGLSGTVEGNRIMHETTLIMREFANAAKPLFDLTITGMTSFRKVMQSLSPESQKVLMSFMGLSAVLMALRVTGIGGILMSGAGMAFRGGASLLGHLGGGMGAGAAQGAASRLLGGAGGSVAGGAAAGAGSRLLGGGAAAGGAGSLLMNPMTAMVAAPLAWAAGQVWNMSEGPQDRMSNRLNKSIFGNTAGEWMDQLNTKFNPFMKPTQVMDAHYDPFRFEKFVYGKLGMTDTVKQLDDMEKQARPSNIANKKDKKDEKTRVTIADAGFSELGSGYERLADAFALIMDPNAEKKKSEEESFLTKLGQLFERWFGEEKTPEPGEAIRLQRGRN